MDDSLLRNGYLYDAVDNGQSLCGDVTFPKGSQTLLGSDTSGSLY